MQATRVTRFAGSHQVIVALVLGVLASSVVWLTALSLTGNVPTRQRERAVASSNAAAKQMNRDAIGARWEARFNGVAPQLVAQAAAHAKLLQFYAHKEELHLAMSTARDLKPTSGLDRADTSMAIHSTATLQTSLSTWLASPGHIGFMGLRYAAFTAAAGLGTHPTDRGSHR